MKPRFILLTYRSFFAWHSFVILGSAAQRWTQNEEPGTNLLPSLMSDYLIYARSVVSPLNRRHVRVYSSSRGPIAFDSIRGSVTQDAKVQAIHESRIAMVFLGEMEIIRITYISRVVLYGCPCMLTRGGVKVDGKLQAYLRHPLPLLRHGPWTRSA